MTGTGPGTLKARRDLGAELRRRRGNRTATDVAAELNVSPSTVTRTELGERDCSEAFFHKLADALGIDGPERAALEAKVISLANSTPTWWEKYGDVVSANYATLLGYEETAVRRRDYQTVLIPAHVQTRDYAMAVTSASFNGLGRHQIEDMVAIRETRQLRLTNEPALELDVLRPQSALMFVVGGAAVHREQLAHLIDVSRRPNVSIRLIPWGAGEGATFPAPFQILSYGDDEPEVVFGQGISGSTFMEEPRDVRRLSSAFRDLAGYALNRDDSRELIASIMKEQQ